MARARCAAGSRGSPTVSSSGRTVSTISGTPGAVNHIPGVCYCRQCRFTGDSIKYLMEIEGLSFREACAELGISNAPVRLRHRPAPREPRAESCTFTPQAWELPTEKWVAYATKLQAEAEQEIWNHPEALKWLAARGITEEAVRTYRLGYLVGENGKAGRYRSRSALGLAPKEQDGKAMTMLFIPRGITIPLFAEDGGSSTSVSASPTPISPRKRAGNA